MKRIIILLFCAINISVFAQSTAISYSDLSLLLSDDNNIGTSRFNALSGAFGPLGSDVSSVDINPAGGAVSLRSKLALTLGLHSANLGVKYYDSSNKTINDNFEMSNGGFLFTFRNNSENLGWKRFTLGLNYQLKSVFNDSFNIQGNGDFLNYVSNPNENNDNLYDLGQEQNIDRKVRGNSSKVNLAISGAYKNNLFAGISFNFHGFDFQESIVLEENNKDLNGNILNAYNLQESFFKGNGISVSMGLIYKINKLRLGLAYESPTWFADLLEEYNIFEQDENKTNYLGYTEIETTDPDGSNSIDYKSQNDLLSQFHYFRSPSTVTLSSAYVFGSRGLISIDYTFKNYSSINRSKSQQGYSQIYGVDLQNLHRFNIGTEWRYERFAFRGGYRLEKMPNKNISDNLARGFSLGLGYNFGLMSLDLAYFKNTRQQYQTIYKVNDISIDRKNSNITATLSMKF